MVFKNLKDNGGRNFSVSEEELADIYLIFEPNNVKSADPITYNEAGNVIPLSERFDSNKSDIRYSIDINQYLDESEQGLFWNKIGERMVHSFQNHEMVIVY